MLRVRPIGYEEAITWLDEVLDQYGPALSREDIRTAWRGMHRLDGFCSRVLERVDPVSGQQVVALSAFVITSFAFAEEVSNSQTPFVAGHVLRRWMSQGDEPLHGDALRSAQQGNGCGVITLHSSYLHQPPGEFGSTEEGEALYHGSIRTTRGLNWRLSLREVFTPKSLIGYRGGGWHVHNRYGRADEEPSLAHPVLLAFGEADARANPGARMTAHFAEYPTYMKLRPVHRELLLAALDGQTDEELAETLSLAVPSIKSRWKALYAHLAEVTPGLYRSFGGESFSGSRSMERRRHLLTYLRDHPEELAPWAPW